MTTKAIGKNSNFCVSEKSNLNMYWSGSETRLQNFEFFWYLNRFLRLSLNENLLLFNFLAYFFHLVLRAHLSISLLSYTVATQVQFHFWSTKIFSRAFFGAGPSPIQVAV